MTRLETSDPCTCHQCGCRILWADNLRHFCFPSTALLLSPHLRISTSGSAGASRMAEEGGPDSGPVKQAAPSAPSSTQEAVYKLTEAARMLSVGNGGGESSPKQNLWLEAWNDPVAGVKAYSPCMTTADLFGDGDWRLVVATMDRKLKARRPPSWREDASAPSVSSHLAGRTSSCPKLVFRREDACAGIEPSMPCSPFGPPFVLLFMTGLEGHREESGACDVGDPVGCRELQFGCDREQQGQQPFGSAAGSLCLTPEPRAGFGACSACCCFRQQRLYLPQPAAILQVCPAV